LLACLVFNSTTLFHFVSVLSFILVAPPQKEVVSTLVFSGEGLMMISASFSTKNAEVMLQYLNLEGRVNVC
jgi:hypothetical protein